MMKAMKDSKPNEKNGKEMLSRSMNKLMESRPNAARPMSKRAAV